MNMIYSKHAGIQCPLCGGSGRAYGEKEGATLRLCTCESGSTLLSWTWGSEEEYQNWYAQPLMYTVKEQVDQGQLPVFERQIEKRVAARERLEFIQAAACLRPYAVRPRLLDIGCCTGELVWQSRISGFVGRGLEPNASVISRYFDGKYCDVGTWQDAGGEHEVITLIDVLEHLTRPRECLAHLGSLLSPKGILYIEMPEWGCPESIVQGVKWRHVRPKQHVCLYSRESAEELFRQGGLFITTTHLPKGGSIGKIAWILRKN